MTVRLTKRDIDVFKFIFKNSYVTTSQIHRATFRNNSRSTVKARIYQLALAGYLEKINGDDNFIQTLFRLKRAALDELLLPKEEILRYERKKLITEQLTHDLKVIDCRTELEPAPNITGWIPSQKLREYSHMVYQFKENGRTKVPDAIFDLKAKGTTLKVAFEFENTAKKKSRYFNIFEKYLTLIPVDLVLYVVRPLYLKDTLLSIGRQKMAELKEREISVKNKLYVATLEDFEKHGLQTYFEGVDGKKFSINALSEK